MSTPDRRDRGLEAMLRRPSGRGQPTPDCLDAETLAAWVEGGLDRHTRAAAEAHAAGCARCQAMLAAIVRTEPGPEEAPATASIWERIGLRWLIPLTAAAAAVLLWMVVPPPSPTTIPSDTVAMTERPTEPVLESAPARAAAVDNREPAAAPVAEPASPAADKPAPEPVDPRAAGRLEAEDARPPDRKDSDVARRREAAPEPAPREQLAKQAAPAAADALNEAVTVREERAAPAPPPPAAPAAAPAEAPRATAASEAAVGLAAGSARQAFADRAASIVSGDASAQWRLAGPGVVERSRDGGRTWERLALGVSAEITSGAAPSAEVCWLVGRQGLVLLSTDARTWRRVAAPTTVDLVAVEAVDARTATVRTSDGTTFRTVDGGTRWNRVP